jgi:hypothetical protein
MAAAYFLRFAKQIAGWDRSTGCYGMYVEYT